MSKKILFFPDGQPDGARAPIADPKQKSNPSQTPIDISALVQNVDKLSNNTKSLSSLSKEEDHPMIDQHVGGIQQKSCPLSVNLPETRNNTSPRKLDEQKQGIQISFVNGAQIRSTSKDSKQRLDGVNTANSRVGESKFTD